MLLLIGTPHLPSSITPRTLQDTYLHLAPLFHIGGLSSGLACLMAGSAHVVAPRFSAPSALALMRAHTATAFIAGEPPRCHVWRGWEQGGHLELHRPWQADVPVPASMLLAMPHGMQPAQRHVLLQTTTLTLSYASQSSAVPAMLSDLAAAWSQGQAGPRPPEPLTHVTRILLGAGAVSPQLQVRGGCVCRLGDKRAVEHSLAACLWHCLHVCWGQAWSGGLQARAGVFCLGRGPFPGWDKQAVSCLPASALLRAGCGCGHVPQRCHPFGVWDDRGLLLHHLQATQACTL